jgi:hypothetical protein
MRATLKSSLLSAAATLLLTSSASASIMASATVTANQISPSTYDYSITLNNTGDTNIGTFWFSWIPGAAFLSAVPTDVQSPAGWSVTATNSGAGLRWVTTTNVLAAGNSLTGFEFLSTETPAQLASTFTAPNNSIEPATVFYVYTGAPLVGPSFTSDAAVVTPEPSSLLLAFTGALAALALYSRRGLGEAS